MPAKITPLTVTHPDHGDELGTVVDDARRAAWTPNDLTVVAPDFGMVKVRWADSVDPQTLFWEYSSELHCAAAQ